MTDKAVKTAVLAINFVVILNLIPKNFTIETTKNIATRISAEMIIIVEILSIKNAPYSGRKNDFFHPDFTVATRIALVHAQ